jgi:ferredoxin-NADP reductase
MVTYEEKGGRPTVHALLESLDGVRCPGLFVCGPKKLMQELRDAVDERCQIRIRHGISGTPHIAMYEESFEL